YVFNAFFFFQAEDGIRDGHVTGVQTCALPIYGVAAGPPPDRPHGEGRGDPLAERLHTLHPPREGGDVVVASRPDRPRPTGGPRQIGRASCRERVESSVGAVS